MKSGTFNNRENDPQLPWSATHFCAHVRCALFFLIITPTLVSLYPSDSEMVWQASCWLVGTYTVRLLGSMAAPPCTDFAPRGSPADVEIDTENMAGVSETNTAVLKTPVYRKGSAAHTFSWRKHAGAAGNKIILLCSGSRKKMTFRERCCG